MSRVPAEVRPFCDEGSWSSLGAFLPHKPFRSGSEQSRDVVLQSVDVQTARQDRCLLEGLLLQERGGSTPTGRISRCFISRTIAESHDTKYEGTELFSV